MNNPGMDFEIWEQLRKKWIDLDAKGHELKIDFQLIADPIEEHNILAIDVIQYIDGKPVTETVQHNLDEVYGALGIANLSVDDLKDKYKEMLHQLRMQSKLRDIDVVVTMTLTSPTSGEVICRLEVPDAPVQSSVLVNYQHYYVLNAIRDRMTEMLGKSWKQVRAVYHSGNLEFYFDYS